MCGRTSTFVICAGRRLRRGHAECLYARRTFPPDAPESYEATALHTALVVTYRFAARANELLDLTNGAPDDPGPIAHQTAVAVG